MTREYRHPCLNARCTDKAVYRADIKEFWNYVSGERRSWTPITPSLANEMRLLSRQYRQWREEFQSLRSLPAMSKWLNTFQYRLYLAPMVQMVEPGPHPMVKQIKLAGGQRPEEGDVDLTHQHILDAVTEPVKGPGWEIDLRIYVRHGTRKPLSRRALREGLASYGIYIDNLTYENDEDNVPYYGGDAVILQRDFVNLKDVRRSKRQRSAYDGYDDDEFDEFEQELERNDGSEADDEDERSGDLLDEVERHMKWGW